MEEHFGKIDNPRIDWTKLHKLLDMLLIAICAVIAEAHNWEDIAKFDQAKREWFKEFLELPNGIPSLSIAMRGVQPLCLMQRQEESH